MYSSSKEIMDTFNVDIFLIGASGAIILNFIYLFVRTKRWSPVLLDVSANYTHNNNFMFLFILFLYSVFMINQIILHATITFPQSLFWIFFGLDTLYGYLAKLQITDKGIIHADRFWTWGIVKSYEWQNAILQIKVERPTKTKPEYFKVDLKDKDQISVLLKKNIK